MIRRFVAPDAVSLFIAPSKVSAVADRNTAMPFDIEDVYRSHREELCTFDVMVEKFGRARNRCFRAPNEA
nr:chromate resistance protein ChrB domain-containing protein [Neorhizobium alkalisoli]